MASPTDTPGITRTRLPGIGERTEIRTVDDDSVAVVELVDGSRELQVGSGPTARLSATEARSLGAVLAGTFSVDPALLDDMGAVLGGLRIDATRIRRNGALAGRSIGELEIRARHRVTVVAVLLGSLADVAPGPETVLEPGARVVVIGRPDDVDDFLALTGTDHES